MDIGGCVSAISSEGGRDAVAEAMGGSGVVCTGKGEVGRAERQRSGGGDGRRWQVLGLGES